MHDINSIAIIVACYCFFVELNFIHFCLSQSWINRVLLWGFCRCTLNKSHALPRLSISGKDKAAVDLIVRNALESLSPEDQKLPQILSTLPILRRGIGIHHGGLLPILKEIVEILFAEGYLKVGCWCTSASCWVWCAFFGAACFVIVKQDRAYLRLSRLGSLCHWNLLHGSEYASTNGSLHGNA